MYSMALALRCFKWKMLSLSGPKALLFLQLLIAFITRSVVNVRTISNGFLLVSLVTTLVSLEEVCLPSFEVLNCWLNLVASCLDDENEIPNDTAYKRWSCHSGLKLLCKLCRPPPQQWGPDLPFFGHAGHADPLDGWRCCSQKRVMSRPIQVRQL